MKNKSPDAYKSVTAHVGSPTKKPRFTLKGLLFWTAVVTGVIPAVLSGEQDPTTGIFITGVYLTVVCGIATLVLYPRSFDTYFPILFPVLNFSARPKNVLLSEMFPSIRPSKICSVRLSKNV